MEGNLTRIWELRLVAVNVTAVTCIETVTYCGKKKYLRESTFPSILLLNYLYENCLYLVTIIVRTKSNIIM